MSYPERTFPTQDGRHINLESCSESRVNEFFVEFVSRLDVTKHLKAIREELDQFGPGQFRSRASRQASKVLRDRDQFRIIQRFMVKDVVIFILSFNQEAIVFDYLYEKTLFIFFAKVSSTVGEPWRFG